jgi:periplasmic divalent cation tolerance protein
MKEYIQVYTTFEKRADAEKLAGKLVQSRLAACVQTVGPILSTYWWEETMEKAEEYLCLIKTTKSLYGKIENAIKEMHPYETPEIVALPIIAGSKEYLKWLGDVVKPE